MPTARPRHAVTETEEITRVLEEAANKWPGVARSRLIPLVLADWAAGGRSPSIRAAARRALVGTLPGSADLYRRDEDWPA